LVILVELLLCVWSCAALQAEISEMFEDETVDITCPKCGHRNSLLVREVEAKTESHIVCTSCKVRVKIDAKEFQLRLDQVRQELEDIQRKAHSQSRKPSPRRAKDDYQI
jgi:transcription elongation factor Elf1